MNLDSKLFRPLTIGDYELSHRVIMAPLTRYRAPNSIPGELMQEYYEQRASKGGLIITESTAISKTAIIRNAPRIDTPEAQEGWKKIVDKVHNKGGLIFCQLNHYGRAATLAKTGTTKAISSSTIPIKGEQYSIPKEMDEDDMTQVINDFAECAVKALEIGFDGVELHGANGYLLDQFIKDEINQRTDEYGGSIEKRCKFPLRVLDEVISRVGSTKVAYRISPWDIFQDAFDSNPLENFSYFCQQLQKRNLAFIHVIEARSDANGGRENDGKKAAQLSKDYLVSSVVALKKFVGKTPLLSAGGWNSSNIHHFDLLELDGLVFGRYFISNPDLPKRLEKKLVLNAYDRSTFYKPLIKDGYTDYVFAS